MEGLFERVTTSVSLLAGLASFLSLVATVLASYSARKLKLKKAKEESLSLILETDDISALGAYVDNVVGAFTMREYATNSEVERSVDTYIERIQEYIGSPEEIDRERDVVPSKDIPPTSDSQLPSEFHTILEELRTGESWNALARLRRHVEVTLREKARQADLAIGKASSVGPLLTLLEKHGVIESQVANGLRYPISVSNRAIHGHEVSQAEAEEAIFHAARVLQSLRSETSGV